MKFPRNARMFKGQLDAAPFACVLFCLLIFLMLALVVPIPGIPVHLPDAIAGETGVEGSPITVALDVGSPQDPNGVLYFQQQVISELELQRRLKEEVKKSPQPLTLVVQADKRVTIEQLNRLTRLAQKAGIKDILQATLPGVFESGAGPKSP
jgi:biopolymer transport protein ExbD